MKQSISSWVALLVVVAGLSVDARAQRVLTVDAAGGAMFADVAAAVAAANSGDTVLIRPGTYPSTIVDDKALALVGDGRGVVVAELTISNTRPGATVVVQRLESNSAVRVESCAGEVWIEDCEFDFGNSLGGAIYIRDSAAVQLHRVDVNGALLYAPVPALWVERSSVHVFEGRFVAGPGSLFLTRPGLHAIDSFVYLQGAEIVGGSGPFGYRSCGGDGGPGVFATGASSVVELGAQLRGGAPGVGDPFFCPNPTSISGPRASVESPAAFAPLPGTALELKSRSVVREGQPVDYVVDGLAGDVLVLAFGVDAGALFFPLVNGTLASGANFTGVRVGTIGAAGTMTVATIAPTLPAGVDASRYFVQALALRANGTLIAGAAQAVTMLDAAF